MSVSIDIHPSHNDGREIRIKATAIDQAAAPLWLEISDSAGVHIAEITLFTHCGPLCDQLAAAINEINKAWCRLPAEITADD